MNLALAARLAAVKEAEADTLYAGETLRVLQSTRPDRDYTINRARRRALASAERRNKK